MKLLWTGCAILLCSTSSVFGDETSADPAYVQWLEQRSMLHQAQAFAQHFAGNSAQWQHPYGVPQPRAASAKASVWFTAYPAATVAATPGASVLTTLADGRLWSAFQSIGIQAIHTGPVKRSGGISDTSYTPSVDGNFDRISFDIDPAFGTEDQYKEMVQSAHAHGAVVIGDIIPGHTGKGADFLLAERGFGDYPGLYHMVRIAPEDWGLLPPVPAGRNSVNLSPATVDALQARHYIAGMLSSRIFYASGVKDSDWSATDVVRGLDGVSRRWVYLHYFKEGQPTLNWLDPTFAAQRLVIGDAVHELTVLGDAGVRLDANDLLGVERYANNTGVWSEGHPLSDTTNQLIADMVRKMGGFTFQELALTFDKAHNTSNGGADLTYDFVTRPAYEHALLTGDAGFLRLIFQLMLRNGIDPGSLIHALQNHDELDMGLPQFTGTYANDHYSFRGRELTGRQLRDTVREEMYSRLIGSNAPYNLEFGDGVASTTATVITAALGIKAVSRLSAADIGKIKRIHLLLAFYNAFQPGVFALSGWDLVGALTLPGAAVKARLADGDTRWINRGAYDLIGSNAKARTSAAGLPVAVALYGPLPKQLESPDSFAFRLARMLKVRTELRLYAGRLIDAPALQAKALFVLTHQLPDTPDLEVTAINFGSQAVAEAVVIGGATQGSTVTDVLDTRASQLTLGAGGTLQVALGPYEAKAFRIKKS